MNKFIQCKLVGAGVTFLSVAVTLIFAFVLNPTVLFSQGALSVNEKGDLESVEKPHEHKFSRLKSYDDPFRFPMPLGELHINGQDSIHDGMQKNSQHSDRLLPSSGTITKQSTFKATIIPDRKTTKKMSHNTSKLSFDRNTKSAAALSNTTTLNHQKSSSVVVTDANITSRTYIFDVNGKDIPLRYEITGFSNKVLNMTMRTNNATLLIYISSLSPGEFTIELPRNIIDSTNKDMHSDSQFAVLEDGHYTSFYETENNNYTRKLTMPFNKGTSQIVIAGTHASPEYGATTTALYGVSMCISITVLILVARRSRFSFTH